MSAPFASTLNWVDQVAASFFAESEEVAGDPWLKDLWARAGGFCLPSFEGRELVERINPHLFVAGPTGTGKGITVINTTLLDGWYGSAIIHDMDGELYELSAWRRSRFSNVLLFDPTDINSVRFNPLDEVRSGLHMVPDVQNIMAIAMNFDPKEDMKDHWKVAGYEYSVAVAIHLLKSGHESEKNIGGVRRFIQRGDKGALEILKVNADAKASSVVKLMFEIGGYSEEEDEQKGGYRGSVYNSAGVMLMLWDDEIVDKATSVSEFRVSDLMCEEAPISLYLINRASDSERIMQLLKLIVMLVRRQLMSRKKTDRSGLVKRHALAFILDEFLDFNIPDIEKALTAARKFGIRMLLACQSVGAVHKQYGRGNSIIPNCGTAVVFRPAATALEEQELIKELVGRMRISTPAVTHSGDAYALISKTKSVGERIEERYVLPVEELMLWPPDRYALVFGLGKPLKCDVVKTYEMERWTKFVGPPPPIRDKDGIYIDLPPQKDSPWKGVRERGTPIEMAKPKPKEDGKEDPIKAEAKLKKDKKQASLAI